jgi:iron complex transport system substrate-binding protein
MRSTVDSVRANVSGLDSPSVLYALGGGFTAGSGTFIDTLITAAGGENVATEAGISGYGQISSEVIVQQNPDWLVVPAGTPLPQTEAVNATTAVQEGQILRVNSNYMNQPGPRNTIPLRQMAEAFHPDAFSADTSGATVTPTGAASPTATPTAGEGEPTATPTGDGTETPGASGPGFTAVLTVIGLLGTALLARRR